MGFWNSLARGFRHATMSIGHAAKSAGIWGGNKLKQGFDWAVANPETVSSLVNGAIGGVNSVRDYAKTMDTSRPSGLGDVIDRGLSMAQQATKGLHAAQDWKAKNLDVARQRDFSMNQLKAGIGGY